MRAAGLGSEGVSGNFETSNQPNFSDSNNEDQSGGIFSTPELTVDSENVPDPNAISDDDKSRVAAVFQKTDASARRHAAEAAAARERAIAEEMNEAALAAADIPSTATGDIKLAGEKKKHKKAPLIIIFLVLAVMAGVGVWWLVSTGAKGEEVRQEKVHSLKESYNIYMNYLSLGVDSSADFSFEKIEENYSINFPYSLYAEAVIAGVGDGADVDKVKYIADLDSKYSRLAETYKASHDGEELGSSVYDYFYVYASLPTMSTSEITNVALGNDWDTAIKIVDDFYSGESYSSNSIKQYLDKQRIIVRGQVLTIQVAQRNGCLDGDEVTECPQASFTESEADVVNNANLARLKASEITVDMRQSAMDELARLYEELYDTSHAETGVTNETN